MPSKPQFRRTFIRAWRQHRGLTLDQVAEQVGDMVPSNLSMLERGLRGYTQNTLEKIAEVLGTDAASLLSRAPGDDHELWAIWQAARPAQKQQIVEIARTITKPGRS